MHQQESDLMWILRFGGEVLAACWMVSILAESFIWGRLGGTGRPMFFLELFGLNHRL